VYIASAELSVSNYQHRDYLFFYRFYCEVSDIVM